jgi:hypothetical protein
MESRKGEGWVAAPRRRVLDMSPKWLRLREARIAEDHHRSGPERK